MRIAILLSGEPTARGGAEHWIHEVADHLRAHGDSVSVLVPGTAVHTPVRFTDEILFHSPLLELLKRTGLSGLYPPLMPAPRELERFDVVYVTTLHAFRVFLGKRPRLIVGTHDAFLADRRWGIDALQVISVLLLRIASKCEIRIHSICRPITARMVLTSKTIFEIPNPPPAEHSYPVADPTFRITYLGRVSKRKGSDLLLKMIEETGRRPHVALTIAGSVDWDRRFSRAERSHPKNVRFLGNVTDAVKFDELRRSSALLFLSRRDSMPFVVLEALAHGVPVVSAWPWTSSVYPVPGVFDCGRDSGRLAEQIDALYERWYRSHQEYMAYRESIREYTLSRFSRDEILSRIRDMFHG